MGCISVTIVGRRLAKETKTGQADKTHLCIILFFDQRILGLLQNLCNTSGGFEKKQSRIKVD